MTNKDKMGSDQIRSKALRSLRLPYQKKAGESKEWGALRPFQLCIPFSLRFFFFSFFLSFFLSFFFFFFSSGDGDGTKMDNSQNTPLFCLFPEGTPYSLYTIS